MPQKCLLKTSNIMSTLSGAGISKTSRSSTELLAALRENIRASETPSKLVLDPETNEEVLHIPYCPGPPIGLQEDRDEYDVTVKLFHLPTTPTIHHAAYTRSAILSVLAELSTPRIDLLIISFPSITFDADDLPSPSADPTSPSAEVATWLSSYRVLESFVASGHITRLGISEFGTTRLEELLPHTVVKPSVDQINVRDCCVVPKPLIVYAKEKGIELLTHNDSWSVLEEREVGGCLREEGVLEGDEGERKVVPVWVVKYTAVVRSRGVVENKGYIAAAEILP